MVGAIAPVLVLWLAGPRAAAATPIIPPADLITAAKWAPIEDTPPALTATGAGQAAVGLPCPFATLTGWRVGWDMPLADGLGKERWIRLTVRAEDPAAVADIVLYFESGSGWYVGGMGAPSAGWRTLVLARNKFHTEGSPGSWESIRRVRIGVLPAAKRDTTVYVSAVAATSAVEPEDALRVGPYADLAELKAAFPGSATIAAAAEKAESLVAKVRALPDPAAPAAQRLLADARAGLVDAYLVSVPPRPGELRGVWCHSGDAYGIGWTKAVAALADNGFNAVFPNMMWSGIAYYPSKVLPVAPVVRTHGDQLAECLTAAHARGVQVHCWKVCWQFGGAADPDLVVEARFKGRVQVDREGKTGDWLCPSHPQNRRSELAAIREVVRNYDLDGFHLDYIRFPGDEWCFCPTCRAAFERTLGRQVADWPKAVLGDGPDAKAYADYRRGVITAYVAEVRRMIKELKPRMKLSAAVFPVPAACRDSVLQDWGEWIRRGLVDFVCPMNYTEDFQEMSSRMQAELAAARGRAPVYAGLYATFGEGADQAPDMAAAQIAEARRQGAGGFVLFEMEAHVLTGLLPQLRRGVTRE